MKHTIVTYKPHDFPPALKEIDDPPQRLYVKGTLPSNAYTAICIVGSRKASAYGKRVTEHIITGLSGAPVVIVSGLALGIDGYAHRTALHNNIPTIAVPGSGLNQDVLYPKSHHTLAQDIVQNGGCLLSEYEPSFQATRWSFPKRNRIMAGLSQAIIVIEASQRSGTLITARLGLEYNRDVMAVPGSIFSDGSKGTHQLIRDGAYPITSVQDIYDTLHLSHTNDSEPSNPKQSPPLTKTEQFIYSLLKEPKSRDELVRESKMNTGTVSIIITQLELKGSIKEEGGLLWQINS